MKRLVCLALIVCLVPACSWFKKEDTRSAEQLAQDGIQAYNDGDYTDAINDFEKLRDWYPFSKFLILAELKLADAYFMRGDYQEAVMAYEHFEQMHPSNDAIPYVVFQVGMCHYKDLRSPDRDQQPSRDALVAFNRLLREFPDSKYAPEAIAPMKECNKRLAEHDFLVGMFYFRRSYYKAAIFRFEKVLTQYEDVGVHHKALRYLALAKEREAAGETRSWLW